MKLMYVCVICNVSDSQKNFKLSEVYSLQCCHVNIFLWPHNLPRQNMGNPHSTILSLTIHQSLLTS